ncbi:unnamed protein product [Paramecium sonneborni]|uniref:Uncharacterized protein n=1 Tax=Paramecium sonneborni TaxID=65129 RepID=A0A8S1RJ03_9CILI|nr:unnamed protein product [Paramecium sonneborni]
MKKTFQIFLTIVRVMRRIEQKILNYQKPMKQNNQGILLTIKLNTNKIIY